LVTALVLVGTGHRRGGSLPRVEELAELEMLATLGVGFAQGYFLARPTVDSRSWEGWADRSGL